MFHFRGNVTKVIKRDFNDEQVIFKVKNGKESYTCKYNGFLPVDTNDGISLKGYLQDSEILINEKPLVIIPTVEQNVKSCIYKGIKSRGIGMAKAEKVYEEIYNHQSSPERNSKVVNYLNEMSESIPDKFKFDALTRSQTVKLLQWWQNHFSRRRLYLLGLYDTEIKRSHLSDTYLYATLKKNPFKVFSISIEKAKEINKIFGKDSLRKDVKAGEISRFIEGLSNHGWMGCPEDFILKKFPEWSIFKNHLEEEFEMVASKGLIYNHHLFRVEFEVTERINLMIRQTVEELKRQESMPQLGDGYKSFEEDGVVLTEEQNTALFGALNSFITIITGGAGCGKTTLIKHIIKNLLVFDETFVLTSFTGKAVLRIKETLGKKFNDIECHTLHRLIHRKKSCQPVPHFDCLIIDECSMISTELMWEFFPSF